MPTVFIMGCLLHEDFRLAVASLHYVYTLVEVVYLLVACCDAFGNHCAVKSGDGYVLTLEAANRDDVLAAGDCLAVQCGTDACAYALAVSEEAVDDSYILV